MAPVFREKNRTTLMHQALEGIRDAIKTRKLKPGDRLIETQLANEMQISRFPIREALRYLEKEGLVVTKPFKGTYVSRFNKKDLKELYSLRSAIEELAIRLLIKNTDPDKIQQLASVLTSMENAADDKDMDRVIYEDMRFHETICELSGHRKLIEIWKSLENQTKVFITIEKELWSQDIEKFPLSHQPILLAIKSGNSSFAEQVIRTHLENAIQLYTLLT